MDTKVDSLANIFYNKINLLIVDDDQAVLSAVSDLFSSPCFNIVNASNINQTYSIIDSTIHPWHCWILDIAMENDDDGLKILEKYPQFPFILMLSGLGSMTTATTALEKGALKVFDKNPSSLDLLHEEVSKTSALGFVLNGKQTQYLHIYSLLKEQKINSPEEWAYHACITERQLGRICGLHSELTPRFVCSLYYTLLYFLRDDIDQKKNLNDRLIDNFTNNHISFVIKHLEKYREQLSL